MRPAKSLLKTTCSTPSADNPADGRWPVATERGADQWEPIAIRLARHPEQFVGNYSGKSDPLEIADDLLSRKAELLKYGRAQRELHPHLKWAR